MAICGYCRQEMLTADGCTVSAFTDFGPALVRRIPFGQEQRMDASREPGVRCHDCGALPGRFHHPGCDVEECSRCGGQLFSCDCPKNEDGYDDNDNDERESEA